jgi:hypothetical protein
MTPDITLNLRDLTPSGSVRKKSRRDPIMSIFPLERDPEFVSVSYYSFHLLLIKVFLELHGT